MDPLGPNIVQASAAKALELAKKHFEMTTLEKRNSDAADFHELAVWEIRLALVEAFLAGAAYGRKQL